MRMWWEIRYYKIQNYFYNSLNISINTRSKNKIRFILFMITRSLSLAQVGKHKCLQWCGFSIILSRRYNNFCSRPVFLADIWILITTKQNKNPSIFKSKHEQQSLNYQVTSDHRFNSLIANFDILQLLSSFFELLNFCFVWSSLSSELILQESRVRQTIQTINEIVFELKSLTIKTLDSDTEMLSQVWILFLF